MMRNNQFSLTARRMKVRPKTVTPAGQRQQLTIEKRLLICGFHVQIIFKYQIEITSTVFPI